MHGCNGCKLYVACQTDQAETWGAHVVLASGGWYEERRIDNGVDAHQVEDANEHDVQRYTIVILEIGQYFNEVRVSGGRLVGGESSHVI